MSAAILGIMEDTGPVPVDAPSDRKRGVGKLNATRKWEIREARIFVRSCMFGNPRYRWRIHQALQNGTLHPLLEKAFLDMGEYLPKGTKRDDLADVVRGMTILLRKSLSEDPLAEPKKVGESSTVIEHPAQEPTVPAALPPRSSIVPPARPRRTQGKATLKPGEEELT